MSEPKSEIPEISSEWSAVAEAASLPPGTVKRIQVAGKTLALISNADGIHAVDQACPHEGGPLAEGSVEANAIVCPIHSYKFDCKTGHCLTDSRLKLRVYETKIEQGKIWVKTAAEISGAASGTASGEPSAGASNASSAAASAADDPAIKKSSVEQWKIAKHGMDVWPDVERYAQEHTPMAKIEIPELERMKWFGYFYRKNNDIDHYMCRIRIPGCEMTSDQARAVAFIAYESGYSIVDVTTRGNVQVQGLTVDKLPKVREALEKSGLTARQTGHDNVRNITSHPYSGIDAEELIDTRELSQQIQDLIIGSREFSDLPRKCNIALTGRADAAAHAWTQDITFVAAWGSGGQGGKVGFRLLLGGTQGQGPKLATLMSVFVLPEQVLDVTAAVLRIFRELGYRHNRHQVRLRFLIERLGAEEMLAQIEKRLGYALERCAKPLPAPRQEENFLGWFKQKQHDLWAVGVCVPVGRLTWDQLEGLAVIAQQYGWGTLRTTYDQNLVLPGIPSAAKASVGYAIAKHGLTFEADSVSRQVVACTGRQFCNLAVTETKGYAYQLMEELRRRKVQLHGISLHLSGCPSSCGMSYTADIGLKGGKVRRGLRVLDAFDVYLGGGICDGVHMGILYQKLAPVEQLPESIEKIVSDFYSNRKEEETFSQYWRNKLKGHVAQAATGEIAKWRCTHCGHFYVGETPPAFCPVCATLRSGFEPVADIPGDTVPAAKPAQDKVAAKQTPDGIRLVIIGGGIAAHTAAATARSLDPACRITILTEDEHAFYNRLNLTRFLAQEIPREDLFDYKPQWYQENRIEILTRTRVIGLDPVKKTVLLAEGRDIAYDACILAHGSSAATPGFYRPNLSGVSLLRTLKDVEDIAARVQPGMEAGVIGGGVLGLEAAYGILKRGARVRVFEFMPMLMPRQLDKIGGEWFGQMVAEKGIEPHTGVRVKELVGEERVQGIRLEDGTFFAANLVIVSTGIQPNVDWVKRAGLHCERGILVGDRMETSAKNVFAAGDVAQWRGQVIGLWTNAVEQAKIAAANAVGKTGFFQGFLPVTILKCLGIPLISMGEIKEDGGTIRSKTTSDAPNKIYRRVILREGIPVGGILLGTSSGMGQMRKLIESGLELEKLREKVLPVQEVVLR